MQLDRISLLSDLEVSPVLSFVTTATCRSGEWQGGGNLKKIIS